MNQKYEKKIRFEDIMIWVFIIGLIIIALWMLHGSPTEMGAIIAIGTFGAGSIIMIWKYIFTIDKNLSLKILNLDKKFQISFNNLRNDINNKFNTIENKLDKILK